MKEHVIEYKSSLNNQYEMNSPTDYSHPMERISYFNIDEVSSIFLRALPNQDGIMRNDVFLEGLRTYLGLPSHVLTAFNDGCHYIGRNRLPVDGYGIAVRNAGLKNSDYHRAHYRLQSMVMDMFKISKIYAVQEPHNIFHGLVPPQYLKAYCHDQSRSDAIIPDIRTSNHPTSRPNRSIVELERIFEVKTVRVDTAMSKYHDGRPKKRGVEKRAKQSATSYIKHCGRLDQIYAPNNPSKPFTTAYQSYGNGGAEHIIVGHFGELNDEFKSLIHDSAQLAGLTGEAHNMTPLDQTHDGKPSTTHLLKRRFFTAIGCMGVRIQSELLLRRLQFIRNSPEAAYSAATAGARRSYNSEYGSSAFSDKENADSYSNFRSCPHSYSHKAQTFSLIIQT